MEVTIKCEALDASSRGVPGGAVAKPRHCCSTPAAWAPVAIWQWEVPEATCGICFGEMDGCAPGVKFPGDDCPPGASLAQLAANGDPASQAAPRAAVAKLILPRRAIPRSVRPLQARVPHDLRDADDRVGRSEVRAKVPPVQATLGVCGVPVTGQKASGC